MYEGSGSGVWEVGFGDGEDLGGLGWSVGGNGTDDGA
jgi:hypothetical protein